MPIFRRSLRLCDLCFVQIHRLGLLVWFIVSARPFKGPQIKDLETHKVDQQQHTWLFSRLAFNCPVFGVTVPNHTRLCFSCQIEAGALCEFGSI